ncbi:MAG TPA: 23S rRNA (adenine(2503)-C(2))-methyltransferase RlmN [Candidatus Polarisedimenticolaceae bacterium]|nr:23S rRNA (adenine(2503)-C(2))-methyltransferase RlmN [Candidatus Polarisedimenticolaceae bacterium]
MTNLYGLELPQLALALAGLELRGYQPRQIYHWIYARRAFDPLDWTDQPRALRARLAREFTVEPGRIADRLPAADGTVKYRIALAGGDEVESVEMQQSGRATLCVSSQVGCALGCDFCLTGKMGLRRHLTPGEIVGQVARIQEDRALAAGSFNVVFMGMGEPLHNYDAVLAALRLLADPAGCGLSLRRITVSTAGLAPAIERLAAEPRRPRLAVSLNATSDAVRDRIMPINRRYPLARLRQACELWAARTGEPFTFEYVLLAGVNDSDAELGRLPQLIRGLPAKVNLIPFNAVPQWLAYQPPDRARVLAVRDRLLGRGVRTSIRWSRGAQARAACGQLALLG